MAAYNKPKVLRTVGNQVIKDVWEGCLSCEITKHLESLKVVWTSVDVVQISYVEESLHPVILWIGIQPETLSVEDGTELACSCWEIIIQCGIIDVDVEIRESLVNTLDGSKLLIVLGIAKQCFPSLLSAAHSSHHHHPS